MDVSKNRGTSKWMVKIMESPIKMDDLEVPLFLETPIYGSYGNQLVLTILLGCDFFADMVKYDSVTSVTSGS